MRGAAHCSIPCFPSSPPPPALALPAKIAAPPPPGAARAAEPGLPARHNTNQMMCSKASQSAHPQERQGGDGGKAGWSFDELSAELMSRCHRGEAEQPELIPPWPCLTSTFHRRLWGWLFGTGRRSRCPPQNTADICTATKEALVVIPPSTAPHSSGKHPEQHICSWL